MRALVTAAACAEHGNHVVWAQVARTNPFGFVGSRTLALRKALAA